MQEKTNGIPKISFKETLNLPKTDFPIQANPRIDDPALIERWQKENLYETSYAIHEGNEKFILHDGPPYSNGHIHIGHAYNKILKDIVCKSQRMMAKQVPVIPGWDCHGLPIELKVTQENPGLQGAALKKACRAYAQKWIDTQRAEFIRLGVLMNWDNYYTTMSRSYESSILKAFGIFVDQGYIERKNKTVPWCKSCQTVLAHAEIEYYDQKDPSVYALFQLDQKSVTHLFANVANQPVYVLIWTTTPWTLPLNRAVLAKPNTIYQVLEIDGRYIMVGQERADALCALLNVSKTVVAEIMVEQLIAQGAQVKNPLFDYQVPLILSDTVTTQDGTAFVHCAPGCGPEDYEVGVKNNLEIFSPISADGKYTKGVIPIELEEMPVSEGQIWVIKKLAENNKLLFKTTIKHSYPHCWRCRNPLIFRATKQWFCDLEKHDLKNRAVQAADSINGLPEKSINRLKATLEGRLEWVLSRQRTWGVPIPAVLCKQCDYTFTNVALINAVADQVAVHGIEYWDSVDIDQLLPSNFACPLCKGNQFTKEYEILDVWFESGVSHFAVLKNNPPQELPASMYLEGKDQHRAWFQSSLLTGMVLEQRPPMKEIVTHGFTVDAQGRKMSKSLGNVVSPQEMIDQLGTDGLRLWASSIDISGEAIISKILIDNVKEVHRKIRNTARFLLSNLYDFDIEKDAVAFDALLLIDRHALEQLYVTNQKIIQAYQSYDFTAVFHLLNDYSTTYLSSFYLDIIKDRLYVEQADGPLRRSAQTSCWHILDTMTRLIAPIMSFAAEQISDHYQKDKKRSIHLQTFSILDDIAQNIMNKKRIAKTSVVPAAFKALAISIDENEQNKKIWDLLQDIRSAVLKSIEKLREKGIIKHSLEAKVSFHFDQPSFNQIFADLLQKIKSSSQSPHQFFEEFFIVSQVNLVEHKHDLNESEFPGLSITVVKAPGSKCARCWQWKETVNNDGLCRRCAGILKNRTI